MTPVYETDRDLSTSFLRAGVIGRLSGGDHAPADSSAFAYPRRAQFQDSVAQYLETFNSVGMPVTR